MVVALSQTMVGRSRMALLWRLAMAPQASIIILIENTHLNVISSTADYTLINFNKIQL